MPSIPHWISCTRCGFRRALTPTHPPTAENRAADWRSAQRMAERASCPQCGDVNVVAIELNAYGHTIREAI